MDVIGRSFSRAWSSVSDVSARSTKSKDDNASVRSSFTFKSNLTNFSIRGKTDSGTFNPPNRYKRVRKNIHKTPPDALPKPDDSVHEVRFFLYRILTYKQYGIAQNWPQWVLETVGKWHGTGADLLAITDFDKMCPLHPGNWAIDEKKRDAFPPVACHSAINNAIRDNVDRLKGKEGHLQRIHQETKDAQRKSRYIFQSCQQDRADTRSQAGSHYGRSNSQRAASLYSMPNSYIDDSWGQDGNAYLQSYPAAAPPSQVYTINPTEQLRSGALTSTLLTRATSARTPIGTVIPLQVPPYESGCDSAAASGQDSRSSGNTNSTAKTSPPSSTEDPYMLSEHSERFASSLGLSLSPPPRPTRSTMSLQDLGQNFHAASDNASTTSHGLRRSRSQVPTAYSTAFSSHSAYNGYSGTSRTPLDCTRQRAEPGIARGRSQSTGSRASLIIRHCSPPIQQTKYNDPSNRSLYRAPSYGAYSSSCYSRPTVDNQHIIPPVPKLERRLSHFAGSGSEYTFSARNDYVPTQHNNDIRAANPHSPIYQAAHVPLPLSHRSSRSSIAGSVISRKASVVPSHSMNYPRSNIAGPRHDRSAEFDRSLSPASSSASSDARSIAPSILRQHPFEHNQKTSPTNTFRRPSPFPPLTDTHRFAFEQAEYVRFKSSGSDISRQVARSELERMQGMVPSRMHGEGLERLGPARRTINPATGRPFATLIEAIEEKEILDGKKQRGRSTGALGQLDSDPLRDSTGMFFKGR